MNRIIIFFFLSISTVIYGQKAESPFLEIAGKKANITLKSTNTNVQIAGNIAHVQITQTYQNLGNTPIEAKYIFPMSTKAAVHDMNMAIGNRTIKALVFEKKKAEKIYKKAIKKGKRAAKLDQKRPNVFQMKVGNILPNEEVSISIFYTEMLSPIAGEYKFVYPGVVGPRFTGEQTKNETTFNIPYTKKGVADFFNYNLNVCINAGIVLQKVTSNTHKIDINYPDITSAEVSISKNEINPANRDFILNYSLRGKKIQSGLLLYEGIKENYFAFMVEPSMNFTQKEIPAREYLFVVDVSGSMSGYPLEVSKNLMRNLLGNLKKGDLFNVQLFASTSQILSKSSVKATKENISKAIQFLNGNNSYNGGGTRLLQALKTAYNLPITKKNSARTMVIITDGYISVEKEAFQLIENNLDKANVFTFGIGSSVNRYLIEGMAKVGKSEAFIATNKKEAFKVAEDFKKYITSPLLTQINLKSFGFDIYDIEPKTIPDVFADRPIMVYGKYKGKAKGILRFSGWRANSKMIKEYQVINGKLSKENKALKYLWARKKIEKLDDYKKSFGDDVKEEVTQLGLDYNLATQYTSFVAVDNEIVNKKGKLKKLKQPLPIPLNVNNTAVGAEASINGKSKIKKSFKIEISKKLNSNQKRRIKMWLKGSFSKIINMNLKKYKCLKIHINACGKIVKIEKEYQGLWLLDENLQNLLNKLPNNLNINKEIIVTLKQ